MPVLVTGATSFVGGHLVPARAGIAAGVRRSIYLSTIKAERPAHACDREKRLAEQGLPGLRGLEPIILRTPLASPRNRRLPYVGKLEGLRRTAQRCRARCG